MRVEERDGERRGGGEDGIVRGRLLECWVGRLKGCLIPPGFAVGLGSVSCVFQAIHPQGLLESKSQVNQAGVSFLK
jgi:hypothetical protein